MEKILKLHQQYAAPVKEVVKDAPYQEPVDYN
jgi:hypothetical protein